MLGLSAGESGSYTQLADGIRRFGDDVPSDLRELWRRMIFSLLASNFDDHLRNHGFLMREPGRWSLSPAYDLNPVPEIDRVHSSQTAISEDQAVPSIEEALAVAARFGLKPANAKAILKEVSTVVANWRAVGRRLRLKATTLADYETAFENPFMTDTGKWLRRKSHAPNSERMTSAVSAPASVAHRSTFSSLRLPHRGHGANRESMS